MQYKKIFTVLIILAFGNSTASAINKEKIDGFIQRAMPNASVGILLQDAKTGYILYEKQSDEAFPPASTTKLFTGAAALLALGPEYQYKTVIRIEKTKLKQGILKGDLYIQFSGDPSFCTQDLIQLLQTMKTQGIGKIEGNIVIDNTRFQEPAHAMGWTHISQYWHYAPPITTVILNQNSIPLNVNSNKPIGEKAEISFDTKEIMQTRLTQDVTTVTAEEAESHCQLILNMNEENHIFMMGCWPQQQMPTKIKLSLKNPNFLAEQTIVKTLVQEKIGFSGKVLFEKVSPNSTVLVSHYSKPLSQLLKPLLQDSNNLYAESFLKTLGAEVFQKGTFQMGIVAIKEILSKPTGLNLTTLNLYDGSGLSHYNMITPRQFATLLTTLYHDKKIGKIFMESLPVAGESGTLKERMRSEPLKGRVRAKTGFVTYNPNLAGYLTTPSNKDFIFVIMVDHALDPNEVKRFAEELCTLFVNDIDSLTTS